MNERLDTPASWEAGGSRRAADGVLLFYRTFGPSDFGRPWLVCFHGFPTSSWDWHRLIPLIADERRILVFDFPGYGLSDKPAGRDYSLSRQLDAAEALLRTLGISEFDLLAHDMGNSVACELLYRREQGGYEFSLNSLTLLNGSVYMELARPLVTQRLLRTPVLGAIAGRLMSWPLFRRQYANVYARPESFDESHYRAQWRLITRAGGRRVMYRIAAYMRERIAAGERWTGPLERLDLPLKAVWGDRDPIAVPAIAERLARRNPSLRMHVLEGIGHYPQLEAPEAVAALLD